MKAVQGKTRKQVVRRTPVQHRARQTVEAVLDAVVRVLKRHGVDGVTTNRIAVAAGVSIGSVYQYFPDKRAIYTALHDRLAAITDTVERVLGRRPVAFERWAEENAAAFR